MNLFNFIHHQKKTYKHVFFDLDRTLWDFDQNMRLTLMDIFQKYNLISNFPDYESFHTSFNKHNDRLWEEYRKGDLKKDILRWKRFELTLSDFGIKNKEMAAQIGEDYISESPKKTALIPYTIETLDYLYGKYRLHIITNGFNEVQFAKIKACGIEKYFDWVITSEISGHHKPNSEAFGYPLSAANAKKNESIMVGDDMEIDILGAKKFGIDQIYFNPSGVPHNEIVTHQVSSLLEIRKIL